MAILLTVLKIIGIVLLSILALLVLLLLIVLFVPLRYRIEGNYHDGDEPVAKAKVTYLFPAVSVRADVNPPIDANKKEGGKLRLQGGVRIFGFQIINFFPTEEEKEKLAAKKAKKEAAKSKRKKRSKTGKNKKEQELDEQISALEAELKQDEIEASQASPETTGSVPADDNNASDENASDENGEDPENNAKAKDKTAILEVIRLFSLALPDHIAAGLDQICDLMEKLDKVPDLTEEKKEAIRKKLRYYNRIYRRVLWVWDKDYTQRAIPKIKKCIFRILRSICPKKGHVRVAAGMDDVATTGQIAGLYGILYGMGYPLIGKHVVLEPDFDKKTIDAEGYLKGRIRPCIFVPAAWLYFIDKDVKNLKKAIKTVKNEIDEK